MKQIELVRDEEDTNLRIAGEQDGHVLGGEMVCLLGVEFSHMVRSRFMK